MKKCSTCRKLIIFGSTNDSGYKFCNSKCLNAYHLFLASPDEVRESYSKKPKFDVVHFLLGVSQIILGVLFIFSAPFCIFDSDIGPILVRVLMLLILPLIGLAFFQAGMSWIDRPYPIWLK